MDNLLRFNNRQRYCVFDTETEGLNLVWHRPYQISWLECVGKEVVAVHDHYLWWEDFKISDGAAKVTRFNYDFYKSKAKDPREVYEKFKVPLFCPKTILVCQNFLGFDAYMIKNVQKRLGLKVDYSYLSKSIDTKALATASAKGLKFDPSMTTNFLAWQYRMASIVEKGLKTSQETLLKKYDIPYEKDRLHEGVYDVECLGKIFQKMIWDIEVPNLIGDKT